MKFKHALGTILTGVCLLSGHVQSLDGKPAAGVAWVISMPQRVAYEIVEGEVLPHKQDWLGITGSDGYMEAKVPQGAHLCLQFVRHTEYTPNRVGTLEPSTTAGWTDPACFTVPIEDKADLAKLLSFPAPTPKK